MACTDVAKRHMGANFFGPKELAKLGFSDRYVKPLRDKPINFTHRDFEEWGGKGHGLFAIPSTSLNECRWALNERIKLSGQYWNTEFASAKQRVSRRWILMDLAPFEPASQLGFDRKEKKSIYERQIAKLPHDSFVPSAVEVVVALALYRQQHGEWPAGLQGKVIRTSTEDSIKRSIERDATLLVMVDKKSPELRIEAWSKKYTGSACIVPAHTR